MGDKQKIKSRRRRRSIQEGRTRITQQNIGADKERQSEAVQRSRKQQRKKNDDCDEAKKERKRKRRRIQLCHRRKPSEVMSELQHTLITLY